jgi:hypothetical protein
MSSRRRPKFTNRFTEARRALVQRLVRLRDWFRPTTLFVICFTLLSLVTTLLLAQIHTQLRAQVYSEGDVVRAGVVSPADITAVDERATQAARAVLPNAPPTLVTLKRNQVVARAGDTVTPKMLAQFDAISKYGDTGRRRNTSSASSCLWPRSISARGSSSNTAASPRRSRSRRGARSRSSPRPS